MAARAFQESEPPSKGSLSSKTAKGGQSVLKGARTGEQYIKDMRNRISGDYSSQNSLINNRIKLDGRVRDFLAQKRSVDSTIVYKKPWIGGFDHGKSKTDQARSSLSSLSSLGKKKQQILESHTGPPRTKSILKPHTRPISRTSTSSKTASATTSRAASAISINLSRSDSNSASETQSLDSSEPSKTTRPSTSKSIFSWFSKKEPAVEQSNRKALKESTPQSRSNSASRTVESPETPIKTVKILPKSTEAPSRSGKALPKAIDIPARNVITPSRTSATPMRSIKTPSKKSSKPVQTPSKSTQKQDAADISRCQYCCRPFNAERLEKHESICIKTSQTRKAFDSSKKRLQGTDISISARSNSAPTKALKKSHVPTKPNNWRKKHQELVESLRQAKAVSRHIANGGKASDLPVVVSANAGTPCPHCGRKFAEGSFERHSQICANLKHFGPRKSKF